MRQGVKWQTENVLLIKCDQPEAAAQRSGSGFMKSWAKPRPPKALKLARPGLAYIGPGLAGLTASGRAGTSLRGTTIAGTEAVEGGHMTLAMRRCEFQV